MHSKVYDNIKPWAYRSVTNLLTKCGSCAAKRHNGCVCGDVWKGCKQPQQGQAVSTFSCKAVSTTATRP